jgi:hypothetical protein
MSPAGTRAILLLECCSLRLLLVTKADDTLCDNLTVEQFSQINISFHLYPEDWEHELFRRPSNPTLYPDLARRDQSRKFLTIMKRTMDVFGSALALIVSAPLFVALAVAVKLTSKGPVFFRQERLGEHRQ